MIRRLLPALRGVTVALNLPVVYNAACPICGKILAFDSDAERYVCDESGHVYDCTEEDVTSAKRSQAQRCQRAPKKRKTDRGATNSTRPHSDTKHDCSVTSGTRKATTK